MWEYQLKTYVETILSVCGIACFALLTSARHVQSQRLKLIRHHGKTRISSVQDAIHVDVVLTTYQTLVADWRRHSASGISPIYLTNWHRLILDEGVTRIKLLKIVV